MAFRSAVPALALAGERFFLGSQWIEQLVGLRHRHLQTDYDKNGNHDVSFSPYALCSQFLHRAFVYFDQLRDVLVCVLCAHKSMMG